MQRLRGAIAVALALAALVIAPPPVAAVDVTRERAAQLAAEARADPAALAELERVTSIDGAPAAPAEALAGADPEQLEARLGTLERELAAPERGGADADGAREDAEEIVGGFPEEESEPPSEAPAAGSSDGLDPDLGVLWLPLLILAVLAGALIALRLARNREARGGLGAEDEGKGAETLGELERRAREAERGGDFEAALRLHYAAALRSLQTAGAVPAAPSVTPAAVSRQLGDPRADRLVGTFERVVYGRRPAAAEDARDAQDARSGWPAVVRERTQLPEREREQEGRGERA